MALHSAIVKAWCHYAKVSIRCDTCFVVKMIVWDSNLQPLIAFDESCILLLVFVARNTTEWMQQWIGCFPLHYKVYIPVLNLFFNVYQYVTQCCSLFISAGYFVHGTAFSFAMTHKCFNVIIRLLRTTAPPNPYGQYHAHLPHLATSHQEAKRNLSTPEYQHLDLWSKSVENKVGYHCLSKV